MNGVRRPIRCYIVAAIFAASHFFSSGVTASRVSADIITAFNFQGNAGNETTATFDEGLASTISRGGGLLTSPLGDAFSSTNWTDDGTIGGAAAAGDFFQFSFTIAAETQVALSDVTATFRRSGTGPNSFLWQYDIGSGFVDIGSAFSFTSTSSDGVSTLTSLTGVTALQTLAAGTTVTLRLLGGGATSTAGTFAFGPGSNVANNDLIVNGTISSVPEPATFALGSLLAVSVMGRASWRRFRDRRRSPQMLPEVFA